MAAVVVAPPRVVPLMVVVERCWMEGEAEAAMEANKTRDFTMYTVPPESLPQEGKNSHPPHHPHFHLLTIHPPPTFISIPSPSPHPLTHHLLTLYM